MNHYLAEGTIPEQLSSQLPDEEVDYENGDGEIQAPTGKTSQQAKTARRVATLVVSLAPYFTVSEGGLLLRLHQKKGFKNQGLAQELQMRQQIHISAQAKELQRSIHCTGRRHTRVV